MTSTGRFSHTGDYLVFITYFEAELGDSRTYNNILTNNKTMTQKVYNTAETFIIVVVFLITFILFTKLPPVCRTFM